MDVVYTYVDGTNQSWVQQYAATAKIHLSDIRFLDHGELVFSLQLLRLHCDAWVRRVYIVHAGSGMQPKTLDEVERLFRDAPDRLRIVPQDDLLTKPTFSSCTVEANLWRLPGLSEYFVYSNDDMAFGRPFALVDYFVDYCTINKKPWIDCSAVPASHQTCNLSQQHNQNAWHLFKTRFPHTRIPPVHVSHFPSVMSVKGCEQTWRLFAQELATAPPLRCGATVNFQLLAALVTIQFGLGKLRTRAHLPPHRLARAFVEMEAKGLAYILRQRPHFFCVNGVDQENAPRFHEFCQRFLRGTNTPAPVITQWSWSPDQDMPHLRDRQRELGDDRRVLNVSAVSTPTQWQEAPAAARRARAHSNLGSRHGRT